MNSNNDHVKLEDHYSRAESVLSGWATVGIGSMMLIIALLYGATASGLLNVAADGTPRMQRVRPQGAVTFSAHQESGSTQAPKFVNQSAAFSLGLAGLFLLSTGFRMIHDDKKKLINKKSFGGRPWMWDYPWQPTGVTADNLRQLRGRVFVLIFMTCFLVPFNWGAFYSVGSPLMFKIIAGAFDVLAVYLLCSICYRLLQLRKFGLVRLRFHAFPFHLGDTMSVSVEKPEVLERCERVVATLRCVQESFETSGMGSSKTKKSVCYQIYSESKDLSSEELKGILHFSLPHETKFDTALSIKPPRYWELQLDGKGQGIDFVGIFLLPVYSNPDLGSAQGEVPTTY